MPTREFSLTGYKLFSPQSAPLPPSLIGHREQEQCLPSGYLRTEHHPARLLCAKLLLNSPCRFYPGGFTPAPGREIPERLPEPRGEGVTS